MQPYADIDGDSGVAAFECNSDSIAVEFKDGSKYLYTHASCGSEVCERMKALAASGNGLNSYIMRHARNGYAKKLLS